MHATHPSFFRDTSEEAVKDIGNGDDAFYTRPRHMTYMFRSLELSPHMSFELNQMPIGDENEFPSSKEKICCMMTNIVKSQPLPFSIHAPEEDEDVQQVPWRPSYMQLILRQWQALSLCFKFTIFCAQQKTHKCIT